MDRPTVLLAWHHDDLPDGLQAELEGAGLDLILSRNTVDSWNLCRDQGPRAVLLRAAVAGPEAPELLALIELAAAEGGPALVVLSQDAEALEAHAEQIDDVLRPDASATLIARKIRFASARRRALDRLHDERRRLLQDTLTDFKTRLPNDRCFGERCRVESARAAREERPISVLMIDVDQFKTLNDEHDHEFGDQVLAAVAEVLRSGLRPFDVPARMGGDEFAVLLPNTPLRDAAAIAERLREAVAKLRLHFDGRDSSATITVGVASWDPLESTPFEETVRSADRALLLAKKHGRDRVGVHTPDDASSPTRSADA